MTTTPKETARKARIDSLTREQEATFAEWVERWTAVGLRTGPLTEDEWVQVEAAARKSYRFAGLEEPRIVHGVASPLAAAIAACVAAAVAPAAAQHFGSGVGSGVESAGAASASVWHWSSSA